MITKNARFCPHRSPPTQCAVSVAPARPRKQAMSPDALREHARRVKMPADEILHDAKTVVVRDYPIKNNTKAA